MDSQKHSKLWPPKIKPTNSDAEKPRPPSRREKRVAQSALPDQFFVSDKLKIYNKLVRGLNFPKLYIENNSLMIRDIQSFEASLEFEDRNPFSKDFDYKNKLKILEILQETGNLTLNLENLLGCERDAIYFDYVDFYEEQEKSDIENPVSAEKNHKFLSFHPKISRIKIEGGSFESQVSDIGEIEDTEEFVRYINLLIAKSDHEIKQECSDLLLRIATLKSSNYLAPRLLSIYENEILLLDQNPSNLIFKKMLSQMKGLSEFFLREKRSLRASRPPEKIAIINQSPAQNAPQDIAEINAQTVHYFLVKIKTEFNCKESVDQLAEFFHSNCNPAFLRTFFLMINFLKIKVVLQNIKIKSSMLILLLRLVDMPNILLRIWVYLCRK